MTSSAVLERRVRLALALLLSVGLALRLLAVAWDPPLQPDEYYQYLEPAWWHLTGMGLEPWEFRAGVRSWVLPFYNGAWMALLRQLGVTSGATLGLLVKAHWAAINLSLVVLAFRGGASISRRLAPAGTTAPTGAQAGWEGGLLAAATCALFPLLVSYAGHTLSELPSMLCAVAGLVLTSELLEDGRADSPAALRKAAWVGILVSSSACLRIVNGPLALVAPAWLLARGRLRPLGVLLAAGLVPVLVFGLVDLITWGSFAHSFVGYVRHNLIEGKAADYGTEPPDWYLRALAQRAGLALPLLLLPALLGLRAAWPFVISALGLLLYMSTQPHKEERFIVAFWPLLLIAAGGSLGGLLARLRATSMALVEGPSRVPAQERRWQRYLPWCAALWVVLISLGASRSLRSSDAWVGQVDRLRALSWAGAQRDIIGLIGDVPMTGGALWFSDRVPQFMFDPALLSSPIITHALAQAGSDEEQRALAAGFIPIHRVGEYRVLRRR
jgi:phosphatidylinositol glycan class B